MLLVIPADKKTGTIVVRDSASVTEVKITVSEKK